MQDFDLLEGAKDMSFMPVGVIDRRLNTVNVHTPPSSPGSPPLVHKQRQLRAKVVWRTGEVSWVNEKALQLQHPHVLVQCAHINHL